MNIKVNQVKIYYEVFGQGHPLIFLHGNQEDHHIFDELKESLKDHYKIYVIDSRNHGKSSKSIHFSYDDMTQDIYQFIQKLKLNRPHLLGFSDGGIIGLKLAILAPNMLNKMVICGANYKPSGLIKTVKKELKKAYKSNPNPYIKLMIKMPNIKNKQLKNIDIPTLIIVGQNDVINLKHTKKLCRLVSKSKLIILNRHTHDSYVIHNNLLKDEVRKFL